MEDFELIKSLIEPGEIWTNPDFVCLDYLDVCFQHKYQLQIVFVTATLAISLLVSLFLLLKLVQSYSNPTQKSTPPKLPVLHQSPLFLQIPQEVSELKSRLDSLSQERPDLAQQMKVFRAKNREITLQIQEKHHQAEEMGQKLQLAQQPYQIETPQTPTKSVTNSTSTPKSLSTKQLRSKKRQLKEHDLINQYNKAS